MKVELISRWFSMHSTKPACPGQPFALPPSSIARRWLCGLLAAGFCSGFVLSSSSFIHHPSAYLLYFGLAFILSLVLTPLIRRLARRFGFVARPRDERWHKRPTALLGGIAIVTSFFIAFLLIPQKSGPLWILSLAGLFVFSVGLFDDLRNLKPQTKLLLQIVGAAVLVYLGFLLRLTPYPLLNLLITLLWIVGITNAFNLLDNMDGLCSGIALIAAGFRFLFFLMDHNATAALTTLVFMGAVAGFLLFNFNPASIFMGDSGSLFIGFFLSGLNLIGDSPYTKSMFSVLLFPSLILIIPIFDTAYVTIMRRASGRPISVGGTDHTSHRLVAVGLSERQAVVILYMIALIAGVVAFLLYRHGFSYAILFISFLAIGLALLGIYLSRVRVYEADQLPAGETRNVIQLLADLPYKRQALSVVLDVALITLAYYGAYLLRFEESSALSGELAMFTLSLPIVIIAHLLAFIWLGIYRGVWRYMGVRDAVRLAQGVMMGSAGSVLFLLFVYRFAGFSRSLFIIFAALLTLFLVGVRLSFRILDEFLRTPAETQKKVLIYGAGDGGELLLRELLSNQAWQRTPVGFIDDDKNKWRRVIHGVPVLGDVSNLPAIVAKYAVTEIIVSSSKIQGPTLASLYEICQRRNLVVTKSRIVLEPGLLS
ncbi:MAG: hypothetical protein HYR55_09095 [Acidobacteria bacterium]|nr:hypothetical protein [Acidobacteriota bacterium]MBI3658304.1 hypothetical protein [Acidobacteriota bacterium]